MNKWEELKIFINQLSSESDVISEDLYLIKEKMQELDRDRRTKLLPSNFSFIANEYFNKKLSLIEASKQLGLSKSTFLRLLTSNGFRETRKRYKYILISSYGQKEYFNQKDLLTDLNVSYKALNKYFKGKGRLISQLGIKIIRQQIERGE